MFILLFLITSISIAGKTDSKATRQKNKSTATPKQFTITGVTERPGRCSVEGKSLYGSQKGKKLQKLLKMFDFIAETQQGEILMLITLQ